MSASAIHFDAASGSFHFDRSRDARAASAGDLGRDIVESLLAGVETTWFGLPVGYVVEMLRITGQTGRFYDSLENTADHDFDSQRPTVGSYGEVLRRRAVATEVQEGVRSACSRVNDLITALQAEVNNLRLQADSADAHAEDVRDIDLYGPTAARALIDTADQLHSHADSLSRSLRNMRRRMDGQVSSGSQHTAANDLGAAADQLDETKPHAANKPLAASYSLPVVKCHDARYGSNAIWWDERSRTFNFGGFRLGTSKLGRTIGNLLMRGEEQVTIGGITVSVTFLVNMAREVGRDGEFGYIVEDDEVIG